MAITLLPNPWKLMLDLLRQHPDLPSELGGDKTCATLPDAFPADCPYLQVTQTPGGRRDVQLRLATAAFDLRVWHPDLFTAMELGGHVAAVVVDLEQKGIPGTGGFTRVRLLDEPFPLYDQETKSESCLVQAMATYRTA